MKSEKAKRLLLVLSFSFLAVVLLLIYFSNHSLSEEEEIIELSKKTFDQYAPDYDYLDSPEKWMVTFHDSDGEGTVTVWAPSNDGLRGCVMFEKYSDKISAYYVEVDHEVLYNRERQNTLNDSSQEPTSPPTIANDNEYSDIIELFSSVVPNSEIKVALKSGGRLHAKIETPFPSDTEPEGWSEMIAAFGDALGSAEEKKAEYGASYASAEIFAADEVILASGFNATVQFNKFEEKGIGGTGDINPPTISKFEYDQISVGMTLSKVREIVGGDGSLESSIGDVLTYHFPGEKEGSYAAVLFDDYVVYSKTEFMLD